MKRVRTVARAACRALVLAALWSAMPGTAWCQEAQPPVPAEGGASEESLPGSDSERPGTVRIVNTSLDEPELGYEVLLGRAEELAVRRLGVDVFKVKRFRVGAVSATALQTGWTLGPRTYFAVIQEIQGSTSKTFLLLEYRLGPNLDVMVVQGNDARQGLDVRWRREY